MLPDSYFRKTLADARAHLADVQNLIAILERLGGVAAEKRATRARRERAAAAPPARTRRTRSDKGKPRRIIRDEVPLARRVTDALNANAAGLTVPALTTALQAAGWRTSSSEPAQMVRVALAKLMADKIAIVDKTSDPVVYRLRSQITRRKRATAEKRATADERAAAA